MIDLRSDTVTLPTQRMREAMARAEVGDDVFGEDPTVRRLEGMAAERMGKEAALFVASGTMGNLVSLLAHCGRGDEVILGDRSHTFLYEVGGMAALGGIHPRPILNRPDGTLAIEDIKAAIRPDNIHFPRTRLICLENTHNRCGGAVLTPQYTSQVAELAHRHGLKLHLDGARIFNAAVALGVDVKELVKDVDSVMFCLSKGLSAPVGSLVAGSADFIAEARRMRKMVGGGMRQVGVLAAAGIVALTEMVDRLAEDHARARRLAEGLASLPFVRIDPQKVRTNIVIFELSHPRMTPQEFTLRLKDMGVLMLPIEAGRVRAVTHKDISDRDIDETLLAVREVLNSG